MLPLPPLCGRPCVRRLPDDPITFHSNEYFVPGGIRTCLEVSSDPMLVYFFEFLSTEFAAGRSNPAEVIIVKRLIQGRNNVTRVRIQPKLCDQCRRKNDAFTLSATLPTLDHANIL